MKHDLNIKQNKKTIKLIAATIISMVVIILSVVQINRYFNTKPEKTTVTNKRQLSIPQTAKEIVEDMKLGWNLGNTLEAFDGQSKQTEASYYETLYQNPVTTNQMIQR